MDTPKKPRSVYDRRYRQSILDYRAKENRRYRTERPERAKLSHRKTYFRMNYGLELHEVEALFAQQGGICKICFRPIVLGGKGGAKVDHDHATGKVRGILCSPCNTGLGQFRDNPIILQSAINYLTAAGS